VTEQVQAIGATHGGLPRSRVAEGIGLNAVPAGLCASITWKDVAWIGEQTSAQMMPSASMMYELYLSCCFARS
jgi:hypothetical protein